MVIGNLRRYQGNNAMKLHFNPSKCFQICTKSGKYDPENNMTRYRAQKMMDLEDKDAELDMQEDRRTREMFQWLRVLCCANMGI